MASEKRKKKPAKKKKAAAATAGGKKKWIKILLILLLVLLLLAATIYIYSLVTHKTGDAAADENHVEYSGNVKPGALPSGVDERGLGRESRITSGEEVSGVLFTNVLINLMDEELNRGFLGGWRPNNIIIGGMIPLDNVKNFQVGVLAVVRRITIVMREKLTRKGGGSDEFDPNIAQAMTQFHMDETKFWFPNADKELAKGVDQLEVYIENLRNNTADFQARTDNIYTLLYAFRDLLGDCNQQLIKTHEKDGSPVSMFDTDDYYYFCKGEAHAMEQLTLAMQEEFDAEIRAKGGHQVLGEMLHALHMATGESPWIVLDGGDADMRANHRKNLAAWIADTRHKVATLQDIIVK